jgi:hypothetical protein
MAVRGDGTANSLVSAGSSAGYALASAFSFWFWIPATPGITGLLEVSDGTNQNRFGLYVSANRLYLYLTRSGAGILGVDMGSTMPHINGWHHAAGSLSAAGYTVWVDGASFSSAGTDSHHANGSSPTVTIGTPTLSQYLNGYVAAPALYSSLSQADVDALYAGAAPSSRVGHIASWPGAVPFGATSLPVVGAGNAATLGSTTKLVTGLLRGQASGRVAIPQGTNMAWWSGNIGSRAEWTKGNFTPTGDTLFTDTNDGANTNHYFLGQTIPASAATQLTLVFWAQAGTLPAISVQNSATGYGASFDLTTGRVGLIAGATAVDPILVLGWWRCAATISNGGGCTPALLAAANASAVEGGSHYRGNGTGTVRVLQAQVFPGPDTFPPYVATTSSPLYGRVPVSGRVAP